MKGIMIVKRVPKSVETQFIHKQLKLKRVDIDSLLYEFENVTDSNLIKELWYYDTENQVYLKYNKKPRGKFVREQKYTELTYHNCLKVYLRIHCNVHISDVLY